MDEKRWIRFYSGEKTCCNGRWSVLCQMDNAEWQSINRRENQHDCLA